MKKREIDIVEEIIEQFILGKSIRQLSTEYTGYGRTAINNLIKEFAAKSEKNANLIEKRKLMNKTHKTEEEIEKGISQAPDEADIEILYKKIINKEISLTQAAKTTGRTRDYIKSRIIQYLDDDKKVEEFKQVLAQNQLYKQNLNYEEYMSFSIDKRKKIIFSKLKEKFKISKREMFSLEVLELKFKRLKKYLLETRNNKIDDIDLKLTDEQFYTILFYTPALLSFSLGNKIIPAIENLDNNPNIGYRRTNDIILVDASIIGSSIVRTNLQIKMLADYNYLNTFLIKPRNFRNSPEVLYALMCFHKEEHASTKEVFLSRKQLQSKYNISPEELAKKYDARKEYGEDEYFDGSR